MTHVRGDRFLCVDVESTCWEGVRPDGEREEIIEIGVVEVDAVALSVRRSASLLIRPRHSTVSPFCEALTGLTGDMLRTEGHTLADAVALLRKDWGTGGKAWMTWGRDVEAIGRDCSLYRDRGHPDGLDMPFSAALVDLGAMFSLMTGSTEAVSLVDACRRLGLETEWRRHRAEPDALATARVWCEIARRHRAASLSH